MEQMSLLFYFCWFETYQVFGFVKFVRTSSLLFKDKRRYHNNKIQKKKNVTMFDYKSPMVDTAEFCQNVLMITVVFKAW